MIALMNFILHKQGHHLDLRLIRNQWLLIDPKIEILMSEVNEDKTSEDFREMGLRLAQEVIGFVKKKMDKVSRSGHLRDIKLSFVGHSIGNIIIRAALAGKSNSFRGHLFLSKTILTLKACIASFCRERHGTISKVLVYICLYFWSALGLSL